MSNSEQKYFILRVHKLANETDKAVCVKDTEDEFIWFPKSQIDIKRTVKEVIIRVPEWLAKKNENFEYEEE
jgi:hypothetical protein